MNSIEKLEAQLAAKTTAYQVARAARQNTGSRIESAREAKARQARDIVRDKLAAARR